MLKLKGKFDLNRDVVCDLLRKEASVCRVKGEAAGVHSGKYQQVRSNVNSRYYY